MLDDIKRYVMTLNDARRCIVMLDNVTGCVIMQKDMEEYIKSCKIEKYS